jgi:hypothetical protein
MSDRLRYVLSDPHGEVVCLDDVIKAFVRSADKLKNLEYKNSAHALKEGKKALKKALLVSESFHARLKNEITQEVVAAKAKVDKRVDPNNPNPEWFGDMD